MKINFKPNKWNIILGIVGLAVGFWYVLTSGITACPAIYVPGGTACQNRAPIVLIVGTIIVGIVGYLIGSYLPKKLGEKNG